MQDKNKNPIVDDLHKKAIMLQKYRDPLKMYTLCNAMADDRTFTLHDWHQLKSLAEDMIKKLNKGQR